MIYTINTATNVMFPVIKSVFKLSDEEVYRMINNEHSKLLDKLQKKADSKSKKENNEVCLVFDTMQIKEDFYGNEVFDKLLPLMDKDSTYSVLIGDYIDIPEGKWGYINDEEKGKVKYCIRLDLTIRKKRIFRNGIQKNCGNYIYNINRNEYGDLMFDVCIELPTVNGNIRRTTIGLKYHPDTDNISLVTIT